MKPITKLKPELLKTELWMQNVAFWNVNMLHCNTQQTSYIRNKSAACGLVCLTVMCGANTARSTGLEGEDEERQCRNFWGSGIRHHSSAAGDTSLLARYTVSLGKWLSTFWKDHGASSLLGQSDPEDEGVTIFAVVRNTHPTKCHHTQEELSSTSGKTMWQTWPTANLTHPQSITAIHKYFRITYH